VQFCALIIPPVMSFATLGDGTNIIISISVTSCKVDKASRGGVTIAQNRISFFQKKLPM